MYIIPVKTNPAYEIHLAATLSPDSFIQSVSEKIRCIVIMTDDTVGALYGEQFVDAFSKTHVCHVLTVPAGEAIKTRETKALLEDQLSALGCQRDTLIVALGGGVICDLAGFVAATYHRGIPCCYFPTTLLAIVDAAVGGKTAVNTAYGKNVIGTFTQPQSVMISLECLKTLPTAEWQAGIAEMIKHALLQGPEALENFRRHAASMNAQAIDTCIDLIADNLRYKASVVTADPFDQCIRASLNLGHTFAHMLEAASDYQITHGNAVLWGLYWEACLGVWLGVTEAQLPEQIQALYAVSGVKLPEVIWEPETWMRFLQQDKKNQSNSDEITFTLLKEPGQFVTGEQVVTAVSCERLQRFFKKAATAYSIDC